MAEVSPNRERNAADPIVMFHEMTTLVHPIESSKRAVRAQDIRSVVLVEVHRLIEGSSHLVRAGMNYLWHDKALQAKESARGSY